MGFTAGMALAEMFGQYEYIILVVLWNVFTSSGYKGY